MALLHGENNLSHPFHSKKSRDQLWCQLTACNLHGAGLGVERIQFEIHWTRKSQRDADAEKNRSIGVDPNVEIWNQNVVHRSPSLIAEKRIWHPHLSRLRDS